jgi:hypothetical protein
MSKSNTFENDFLRLVFNNTGISLVGDATGIPGSATAGSLYVSLHTADPGEAGDQTTSETAYTGYARVAVARSGANSVVTGSSVSPNAAVTFGACTAGTATITHFAVGASASGAGKLLYKGAISPTISVSSGVTPQLTTATAITED